MDGKSTVGVYECLGARIRSMREARGISFRQLCDRSDISEVSLTMIGRGWAKLTTEALLSLAAALRVSVMEFFEDDGDGRPPA